MKRTTYILIALLLACCARAQFGALPVVQVQSRWTPTRLGAKLAIWFDGSDASTVLDAGGNVVTDGAYVQTWQDKSGNGRHATALAEAQRPRWFSGIQNGRAVVRTDGNDQLDIGSAGGVFRNKAAGYIFLVAKGSNPTGGDDMQIAVLFSTATPGTAWLLILSRWTGVSNNGWTGIGRRLYADSYVAVKLAGSTSYQLVCAYADFTNGNLRARLNADAFSSTGYSSGAGNSEDADSASASMFRFSNTTEMPADSEIAEVVVVNAAMTDAEVTALQSYLKTKWGTP